MSTIYAEPAPARGSIWPWAVVAVAMVLVAVFLLLGHHSFESIERSAVEEFNRRQLLIAQGATHSIEFYFKALTAALKPLAADPQVQQLDEASTRRDLKLKADELEAFGVWDVGIIDASGIVRFSAKDSDIEGADFNSRRYYREGLEATSRDAEIVEFVDFETRGANAKGLLVGVPMFRPGPRGETEPGRFAGMVCCIVDVRFLTGKFVAPARASRRGHSVLLDEKGNLLWCADRSRFGTLATAASSEFSDLGALLARMLAGETGSGEFGFYAFDEERGKYGDRLEQKLMAYAPVQVGSHTWAIGVWAPREDALELLRSAHRTQQLEMGFSILVVLIGCFLALAIFSQISRVLERRVAEKTHELRDAHARLLTVLDGLDAIVYVSDLDTHELLFVNRHTRELFGEAEGKICWQTLQGDQDGPCEFCTNDRLVSQAGEPAGVVVWELENTRNGRWYELHDRAIRWHDGRVVRLEIGYDITERKRQQEQIVAQNVALQRHRAEIEASRAALARAADQVAQLIDTAARDQSMDLIYSNPNLLACWEIRKCTSTWCPCHGREPMRCWQVEGTSCDHQAASTFAEKVIQCRSCEVYQRSAPDRLTELAEGFNNMMFLLRRKGNEVSQLRYHALQQERMATIGKMASGIAHEIDNPLASLFSLVQVLGMSSDDQETKAQLAVMRKCIDRISRIVREIVDFGRPVGSEEWVYGDVEKIALDTLNLVRYDRRARQIEMAIDFEPALPKTMVIEHQLQQVFMNIVLNALDAMAGEGTLTVRGYRVDASIEVAIADTGEGILEEDMQHIFEPFYSKKTNRRGTGLGLALSYNIVQRHGGSIRVESEPGKGSTFVISVPLREPDGGDHA